MNAVERTAVLDGLHHFDELTAAVDERTLQIVERRRRTAVVKGRGWLVRRVLLAADVVGLVAALLLSEWMVQGRNGAGVLGAHDEILVFFASIPLWVVVAKLYGLYDHDEERTDHSTADDVAGVFHMVTVCTWLFWLVTRLTGVVHPTTAKLALFWAAAVALISVGRAAGRAVARRSDAYVQNTVIVGSDDVGQLVTRKVLKHPEYGINLVGFVDSAPREHRGDLERLTFLGGSERLPAIIRLFNIERVIVASSDGSHEGTLELIRSLRDLDVQIDIVPRLYEMIGPSVGIHTVEGLPILGLPRLRLSRSSMLLKRTFDLCAAGIGLVLLTPFFALIAVLIKLDSSGPVFFRQVRMGSGDRTFRIWKFRTMVADADDRKHEVAHLNRHARKGGDPRMFKIERDPRVTRTGRVLRRFSLDELPQLINVVRGQMSLVGPRPLILVENAFVAEWARRRLDVRPGMTGVWQTLGASSIPFEDMVGLDYMYVTSWSLWQDVKLIARTLPILVRSDEV